MIKVNGGWDFIHDISKTEGKEVDDTLALSILNDVYGSSIIYEVEITDTEIYILSDQEVPCTNCSE